MNFDTSLLFSPLGGSAVLIGLALLMMVVARLRAALVVLGIMLFVGSLALSEEAGNNMASSATWLAPLQTYRSLAYLVCGGLLTLGMVVHLGQIKASSTTGTGLLLLVVAGYAGMVQFHHLGMKEGALTVISAFMTIGTLSVLLPSLVHTWDDLCVLLRTVVFTSVVYAAAVLVQLGISRTPLIAPNAFRFQGISGNPQFVAVFLAVVITTTVFLILNDSQRRFKGLYIALTCLNVVLVGWTGSRTGTLMTMIGLAAVLYTRLGRTIIFAPFVVAGVFGIITLMESAGIKLGLDRLTSTHDTRSEAWGVLLDSAMENPVFGVGTRGAGAAENSFLLATASYGFGSLATLLVLALGVGVQFFRLLWMRRRADAMMQRVVDLQLGFFTMYFAGSMFEGYVIARISVMLPLFLIFSAITTRLLEIDAAQRLGGSYTADGEGKSAGGIFTEAPEHAA